MRKTFIAKLFFIAIIHCASLSLFSQKDDYFQERFVRNDNYTYNDDIQTVLLYKLGFELSPPVIQFRSDEKLVLAFDDLAASHKNYKYTLIHCDAHWNTSQLQQMEYLEGFFEEDITDYQFSFNTTLPYINYVLVFPSDYIRISKSGNYIIKVYENDSRDENVVLTRRFMVVDPKVSIAGSIGNSVDLGVRYTHQQVNFKVLSPDYPLTDAHRDLNVFVMQNGRWDSRVQDVQPRMIIGSEYDFSLQEKLAFPAGNEFRYLDMKTLKYNTDRMKSLRYEADGYHVYIMTDEVRAGKSYISGEDINGRRLVAANNTRDPYSEGDYAWVHFLLPYPEPVTDGHLYVSGALSDWQYKPFNRMHYNFELRAYEAKLLLKQGYFNYAYAFLKNRSDKGDITFIEGSYWETENEYTILVYHRRQGDVYDQLIGVGFVNSR